MGQSNNAEPMYSVPIPEGGSPSQATYMAVAEAKGCDPLDLPPLAGAVDPDALDAFLDAPSTTDGHATEFEYAECSVTVTAEDVSVFST